MPYKKDANGEKQEQAENTYITINTKIKYKQTANHHIYYHIDFLNC